MLPVAWTRQTVALRFEPKTRQPNRRQSQRQSLKHKKARSARNGGVSSYAFDSILRWKWLGALPIACLNMALNALSLA